MKRIFLELWRYWKWLCVSLMTSFIVLGSLAYLLGGFDTASPPELSPAEQCLESSGTWNADVESCERVS
jgi:hypothetical protein